MKCKKCEGESWHIKDFYNRCPNCNHIQKTTTIKILKKELENALGKTLRDIKYLLRIKK